MHCPTQKMVDLNSDGDGCQEKKKGEYGQKVGKGKKKTPKATNVSHSLNFIRRSCWSGISLTNWRGTRWRKMFQSVKTVPKHG